jgi:hypothetical protein
VHLHAADVHGPVGLGHDGHVGDGHVVPEHLDLVLAFVEGAECQLVGLRGLVRVQ